MKSVRVNSAAGNFEMIDEKVREPQTGYARIKVQACGVCHSDVFTKEGGFPGLVYPRSPGHEIAGVIDALGADSDPWKVGDRVGIGWRTLRTMHVMPARRFRHLREVADSRHQL
jgi:D-arabinose 1-dehydrogenase-like Zn-dependent alcohol dehydrogenase